jgi:hypothetical protein
MLQAKIVEAQATIASLRAALEKCKEQSYGDEGAIPDIVNAALALGD